MWVSEPDLYVCAEPGCDEELFIAVDGQTILKHYEQQHSDSFHRRRQDLLKKGETFIPFDVFVDERKGEETRRVITQIQTLILFSSESLLQENPSAPIDFIAFPPPNLSSPLNLAPKVQDILSSQTELVNVDTDPTEEATMLDESEMEWDETRRTVRRGDCEGGDEDCASEGKRRTEFRKDLHLPSLQRPLVSIPTPANPPTEEDLNRNIGGRKTRDVLDDAFSQVARISVDRYESVPDPVFTEEDLKSLDTIHKLMDAVLLPGSEARNEDGTPAFGYQGPSEIPILVPDRNNHFPGQSVLKLSTGLSKPIMAILQTFGVSNLHPWNRSNGDLHPGDDTHHPQPLQWCHTAEVLFKALSVFPGLEKEMVWGDLLLETFGADRRCSIAQSWQTNQALIGLKRLRVLQPKLYVQGSRFGLDVLCLL
ncbi:hypothetical protein BDY24DRAFT_190514 [Mrakia frigida]|uniref:uncharacterized protein n=1 Tax=Mrakia frigida TaxID=29902 RepID=UPI003FCC0DE8